MFYGLFKKIKFIKGVLILMENNVNCVQFSVIKGGIIMAINDKIEVVSHSNEDLYGKTGVIEEIKEGPFGVDLRVNLEGGSSTWIDAEDVLVQNY
jgi:hypothetical protein